MRSPLLSLVLVLVASTAWGQESIHRSPHLEHTTWILGAKVVQLNVWETEREPGEDGGPAIERDIDLHGVGGGFFLERSVIRHLFEIELSVAAIALEGDTQVPIDLLLKKPFHLRPWLTPYLGFGPAMSIDFVDDETEVFAGIAFATGTYFWLSDHFGIDLDFDYTMVFKHDLAHEFQIAIGPAVRF